VAQEVYRMKKLLLPGALVGMMFSAVALPVVTYYRDVLPILQKHCLACHRPGQIAPMSFLSYERTRPWADAIKQVVVTAKMPPWSGGSLVSFGQDHVLSQSEVDTIVQWVEGGAIAGNAKEAPPPAYPEEARLDPDGPESSTPQHRGMKATVSGPGVGVVK
jgi:hypothetical protein